jgi:hypothetical protein
MDRECSRNGEKMNACRILMGKPEEERPLVRIGRRWVDNIVVCFGYWRRRSDL